MKNHQFERAKILLLQLLNSIEDVPTWILGDTLFALAHVAYEQGEVENALAYAQSSFEVLSIVKPKQAAEIRQWIDEKQLKRQ